jgi:hypothetical protein
MAAQGRRNGARARTPRASKTPGPRSMPSTKGAKPSGGHSYGDSTMQRTPKLAASSGPMISPSKQGTFTAKAKAAGMSVQAYAAHVLANKDKFPTATVQQANFAKNIGGAAKKGGK